MNSGRVALVTGASSGIGKETALKLKTNGYTVYGAARRLEMMKDLEKKGIHIISLDVTNDASMMTCISSILERENRIDVLINNAGYGSYGAIEDVSIEEARRQFDVNIFGLARLTQLVLPNMRKNNFGKIVNISSMGGKIYSPFGGWYHATKHALEGFSDCLRLETKGFGIDVIIIEPGGIKTEWGPISAENLKKTSGKGIYAKQASKVADNLFEMYSSDKLTDAKVIANTIYKSITARSPRTRYVKGYMAKVAIIARKWLGDRVFDKIITSMM